jgi:cation transporter-like permease
LNRLSSDAKIERQFVKQLSPEAKYSRFMNTAAAIGIGLPWLLARRGMDPAYGSGPVATVIQDILRILVYFMVLQALGI